MIDESTKVFKWLIDMIPTRKKEAISMSDMATLSGYTTAIIRQEVLNARQIGVLICSCDQGYYFPADRHELNDYTRRRGRYVNTAIIALSPFKAKLKELSIEQNEGDPG